MTSWPKARAECIELADGCCADCTVHIRWIERVRNALRRVNRPPVGWRPGPRLRPYGMDLAAWIEDLYGWRAPGRTFGEVHHVIAREDGGSNDQKNLRYLCQWCHSKYTRAQAKDRGYKRRRKKRIKMGERRPGTVHIKLKMGEKRRR